jgi:glycerate kinase
VSIRVHSWLTPVSVKILIAPDKFKGTLTALAAAEAIAHGWIKGRPQDSPELLPMTDGGDGFGAVMSGLLHGRVRAIRTVNAAHRPCIARWWLEPESRTAIIESANVIGLAMLPRDTFHPFALDTFGLGTVLRAAAAQGTERCLLGIGGSATNDGGFGLAQSLGWQFLDDNGNRIERWTDLASLARVRPPKRHVKFKELMVAVDVQNPLLGMRGATRVYGPQKGMRRRDFEPTEANLRQFASVVARATGVSPHEPGAGAAGGLGFGLMAFAGARLEPGFELFARLAKLDERLRSADLVITGEGRLDASTLMGKGVGEIARRCHRLKIPCIALAGTIAERDKLRRAFATVHALTDLTTIGKAQASAASYLERLARQTAKSLWD